MPKPFASLSSVARCLLCGIIQWAVLVPDSNGSSPSLDPEELRINCGIRVIETDFFARHSPPTPIKQAFEFPADAEISQTSVGSEPQALVGYPESFTVAKGQPVRIRYAGELLSTGQRVVRAGVFDAHDHHRVQQLDFREMEHPIRREPCDSWYRGCRFSESIALSTNLLNAGLYYVFLTDDSGSQSTPIYFHVRPDQREVASAAVVVLLPETTWHAYNYYGGGSLYGVQRKTAEGRPYIGQNRSSRLYVSSMQRPLLPEGSGLRPIFSTRDEVRKYFSDSEHLDVALPDPLDLHGTGWLRTSPEANLLFSRLLRSKGISTVTLAMQDLETSPGPLDHANLLLISGHNEYWTSTMAKAVKSFVLRGGRIANFSGNLMWWQINLDHGAIYQDQAGPERSDRCKIALPRVFRDTGLHHLLNRWKGERFFGLNYRFANYPLDYVAHLEPSDLLHRFGVDAQELDLSAGKGVTVEKPLHPVFQSLGLTAGERIGREPEVLAVEIDGVPLTESGEVDRSFSTQLPVHVDVLASATVFVASEHVSPDSGRKLFGVHKAGVFVEVAPMGLNSAARTISFGSIGFYNTLAAGDARFEQIVLNTVGYLQKGEVTKPTETGPLH